MGNSLNGRPMEILLVEDNRLDARFAMDALRQGRVKHRLTLIPNGTEAIMFLLREQRFAHAPRPDVILLDLQLPGHDGWEVLRAVKTNYDLNRIPVVILTASQDEGDRLTSELLNVEGYMTKPIDHEKFIAIVCDLIGFWDDEVILPAEAQV